MSVPFDVNAYWLKRGRHYMDEPRLASPYHRLQEKLLFDVLHLIPGPLNRVLEVGCGFGRITRLLAQEFKGAQITALDLSPDQLANAQQYCAGCDNIAFVPHDFYSGEGFPGERYDLAVAIEVFLHHPLPKVRELIQQIAAVAGTLVSLDWSENWPWAMPEHVWVHDYAALYMEAGLQCAIFPIPAKYQGMQQELFVGSRDLPGTVLRAEVAHRLCQPMSSSGTPPPSVSWEEQVALSLADLEQVVPPGATLILINEDRWGNEHLLECRQVWPFLERNGQWWGMPEDDAEARRELDRMQEAGAGYLAVAEPCFWWLDSYPSLRERLEHSRKLLANDRLIISQLVR